METNETKHEWEMTQTREEGTKKNEKENLLLFSVVICIKHAKSSNLWEQHNPGIILHPSVAKPQALWVVVVGRNEMLELKASLTLGIQIGSIWAKSLGGMWPV